MIYDDATTRTQRWVLVVDDEPFIRALNRVGLQRLGFQVEEAGCCKVAFALLADASRDYVAVVLDLGLPDGSGAEIAHHVALTRPSSAVIVASGSQADRLPPNALKCPKPYSAAKLAEIVRWAVDAPGVATG